MSEAEVAEALRAARESTGFTQAQLAKEMSSLGFAWYHFTVSRLETGERHLRYTEALALRSLIGFGTGVEAQQEARARRTLAEIRDLLGIGGIVA